MADLTISFDDELIQALDERSRARGMLVEELIVRVMRREVRPRPPLPVPEFAHRLGPIASDGDPAQQSSSG